MQDAENDYRHVCSFDAKLLPEARSFARHMPINRMALKPAHRPNLYRSVQQAGASPDDNRRQSPRSDRAEVRKARSASPYCTERHLLRAEPTPDKVQCASFHRGDAHPPGIVAGFISRDPFLCTPMFESSASKRHIKLRQEKIAHQMLL